MTRNAKRKLDTITKKVTVLMMSREINPDEFRQLSEVWVMLDRIAPSSDYIGGKVGVK